VNVIFYDENNVYFEVQNIDLDLESVVQTSNKFHTVKHLFVFTG